jgi:Family of unknown function (DUF6064)
MTLPFTVEEFLAVFVRYNQAIWPAQVVAYALGFGAVALAFRHRASSGRAISGVLAVFWLVTGALYHLVFFRAINPVATIFSVLFIAQALVFVWLGVVRGALTFAPDRTPRSLIGGVLVLYAMVLYPLLGLAFGHVYPATPVFGVAPCPVTIFTFGVLLWTNARTPKWVLVIPILWAALGLSAATSLGMREDLGLVVAAVVAAALLLSRRTEGRPIGHPRALAA